LLGFDGDKPIDVAWIMIITVSVTTATWLAVTMLTKPESNETLVAFYRRTRPSVLGWKAIARLAPDVKASEDGWYNLLDWVFGCAMIYCLLFGFGKILLGELPAGIGMVAGGVLSGGVIYWDLSRRGWSKIVD
jgi:hypothetical protein